METTVIPKKPVKFVLNNFPRLYMYVKKERDGNIDEATDPFFVHTYIHLYVCI